MFLSCCFCVLLIVAVAVVVSSKSPSSTTSTTNATTPDYLIVGAGGGGLQMALYLHKHNYSYAILEKTEKVGSFWTKLPRFGELISVNKWTRNETQQLRFDWHSLLEAPLQMLEVTEDYFPQGNDWHRYMSQVVEMAQLHVEYGVEVEAIPKARPCVILKGGSERCANRRICVGTGLKSRKEPILRAMGGIPYSEMTRELAHRKRVCIIGNGNSAFETAQNIFDVADRISIIGKDPYRLSAITRYTGDVRVKFLQSVENYYGKLLDSVVHVPYVSFGLSKELQSALSTTAWLEQLQCEHFVIATGFESHVPDRDLTTTTTTTATEEQGRQPGRFPATKDWYEDVENPSIHYIGWLMHERDFRRGAGGFLSGYRYLIRNLFYHIQEVDHGVTYPFDLLLSMDQVIEKVIARVQVADDLIILQDGLVVRDVIIPSKNNNQFRYYQGITYQFHEYLFNNNEPTATDDAVVYVYFAWGDSRSADKVFDSHHHFTDTNGLVNGFLHPVIEVNGKQRHIVEDLFMEWTKPGYPSALAAVIRKALVGDLTDFTDICTPTSYQRSSLNYTDNNAIPFEKQDRSKSASFPAASEHFNALKVAVDLGYSKESLDRIKSVTRRRLPHLIPYEEVNTDKKEGLNTC